MCLPTRPIQIIAEDIHVLQRLYHRVVSAMDVGYRYNPIHIVKTPFPCPHAVRTSGESD
jgi:hypothetical protein